MQPEEQISGLTPALDSLKWDARGLITVIAQVCMKCKLLPSIFVSQVSKVSVMTLVTCSMQIRGRC